MSLEVAGLPSLYFGDCAMAKPAASTMSKAALYTVHLPISRNPPSLGAIVVIAGVQSPRFGQLIAGWLHITGFIRGSARNLNFAAIPFPRHPKARESHCQSRLLQLCRLPCDSPVHADLHFFNPATPGPSQPANLIEPRTRQFPAAAWVGDDTFGVHL